MRWKAPKVGDTRVVRKFAFLPLTIQYKSSGENITIWLEFYDEYQKFTSGYPESTNVDYDECYWETTGVRLAQRKS